MKALVTGGVRSGKSRHAEELLAERPGVTYVAAGPVPDEEDAEWAARVAAHQRRRPASWATRETLDLAGEIASAQGPVLVDCLGTWLTGTIDRHRLWDAAEADVTASIGAELDVLVGAVGAAGAANDLVIVTNEVGLGIVPAHRSGRLFRDLLGTVNQRVAAACDEVHLVVAGRVLVL